MKLRLTIELTDEDRLLIAEAANRETTRDGLAVREACRTYCLVAIDDKLAKDGERLDSEIAE